MKNFFAYFGRKLQHLSSFSIINIHGSFSCVIAFHFNPFLIQLSYFMILSLFGYMGLKVLKPRTSIRPKDFDLFYTSVSASTVSSMTAIEMEVFSNSQLILLTLLMLAGGEVFTSMIELVFPRFNSISTQKQSFKNRVSSTTLSLWKQDSQIDVNQIEIGLVSIPQSENHKQNHTKINVANDMLVRYNDKDKLKYNSLRYLRSVVLGYFMVVHFVGSSLVSLYISFIPSARQVLKNKGIKIQTFSTFIIASTFASCGYVPTNENMIVFKKNSGLLLLILPHVFLGNTLYAPVLRLVIWVLKRVTRREEFSYLLENSKEMGYGHLLSAVHCWLLVATVFGFNLLQLVLFCFIEWNTENMESLNVYEKVVASWFQVTNSRHAGESVFDLSTISSAILVLFVVMMYLPPYTTFLPIRDLQENDAKRDKRSLMECLVFSQLSYLVIFIILICITESKSLREDPLNFNVLSITIEVISAYGNVGFSTGYSCARQLKPNGMCKDSWVGFSGRWSRKGKLILIVVMFFGRLKKFNMKGGKSWDLS